MSGMVNNVFEIKLLYSCNLAHLRRILEDLKLVLPLPLAHYEMSA